MSPVAVAQLPGVEGDHHQRLRWLATLVGHAAERGARLLVLPEAALSGYHLDPGDAHLARAARRAAARLAVDHHVDIIAGIIDADGSRLEHFGADGARSSYLKRFPTFRESRHHAAGVEPGLVVSCDRRAGLLICADLLQTAAWRPLVGRVDLVVIAAAWPDYRGRLDATPRPLRPLLRPLTRRSPAYLHAFLPRAAAAMGVPVLFANLAGTWRGVERFTGGSAIYGPDGAVLAAHPPTAGRHRPAVVFASLPPPAAAPPARPPRHPLAWRGFSAVHRWTATTRRQLHRLHRLR